MTVQREIRPLTEIQELVIRGSADVTVKRGEPSMMVIAEKTEDVITEIRDGVLIISQKPTVMVEFGGHGVVHIQGGCIQVAGRQIYSTGDIVNSGGMTMIGQRVLVEITLPDLPAGSITGSGDLSLDDLQQDEIELAITGSGTIRASGQVARLTVDISGSGDVKAKELQASVAELRVSGSGDINAQATQSLSARVSGSGDIKVWGNPAKRDTRVSGSGEIKFK